MVVPEVRGNDLGRMRTRGDVERSKSGRAMKEYQMINRDYLLKAEIKLVDAMMEARRLDDDKLADLIGKTLDRLSLCRSRCWEMEYDDE